MVSNKNERNSGVLLPYHVGEKGEDEEMLVRGSNSFLCFLAALFNFIPYKALLMHAKKEMIQSLFTQPFPTNIFAAVCTTNEHWMCLCVFPFSTLCDSNCKYNLSKAEVKLRAVH